MRERIRSGRTPYAVGVVILALVSCRALLPERFVLNAPIGNLLFGWGIDAPPPEVVEQRLQVPDGFSLSIFAAEIANARMLRFTTAGDLLVSTPRKGAIRILSPDRDGDGRSDGVRTLLDGLAGPHGLDLHDDWLYVAEGDAIGRVRFDAAAGKVTGAYERIVTGLPSGGNHWTRTLRFGPDGWLYVSIGSSCNACIEEDPRRAAMMRFHPDGSEGEIYATGLRNSVDFDWRPQTGELYATDNGRDLLGDDFPPCELDRIARGGFYGWPFANGDRVPDPDHGTGREKEIAASIPPVHGFAAHTAPLGITFLRGEKLPPELRGTALVALHGSWNRTRKSGYSVVQLRWDENGRIEERDFLTGFEHEENVIGRPVAVAEGPDGAVYVSDDYAGVIYRIARGSAAPEAAVAESSVPPGTRVADPERVERGRSLYARFECARCHEDAASSEGMVVKRLEHLATRYSAKDLAEYLAVPNPPMPVFPLDESERADLAAFLLDRNR